MSGFGVLPELTRPTASSPFRQTYASPRSSTSDEHGHLDQAEPPERVDVDGPREDEDRLDVEDDEEQGVHVITDVHLAEQRQRIGARFVGDVFVVLGHFRAQEPRDAQHRADHHERGQDEDRDGEILPVELGHARFRCRLFRGRAEYMRGLFAVTNRVEAGTFRRAAGRPRTVPSVRADGYRRR